MTDHATTDAEIRKVIELVLQLPATSGDITRDDTPQWDSLKHVEIVFSVEDACEVRFDPEQIQGLRSLEQIVNAVEAQSS